MNQQPFKLFSINGYHKGKLTICRQPFSNEEFHKIKAWEADAIVTMTNKEEFEIDDFEKKNINMFKEMDTFTCKRF